MVNQVLVSRRMSAYFTAMAFHCCMSGALLFSSANFASAAGEASDAVTIDLPAALSTSKLISHAEADKLINIVLVLRLSDEKGADEFAQRVSAPNDPLYRKYLTPQEYGEKFGPSVADYSALENWAKANGLFVQGRNIARTTLTVRGSIGQLEKLFGVQVNNYQAADGKTFFSPSIKPSVPSELHGRLTGIVGFSNYTQFAPLVQVYKKGQNQDLDRLLPGVRPDTAGGNGPGGAYDAKDLRIAYNVPLELSQSGIETVAVFEQGGFDPADVAQYEAQNHLPNIPVQDRNVNGYGGGIDDPGVELEAVLDIDMIIGINPKVKQVIVYEDGQDAFQVALLDSLVAMANDDAAQVISISYGIDEIMMGNAQMAAENKVFKQLAAQGQTVFVSAGDQGAYGRTGSGLNVSDPGAQPYVTSVGGTSLYTGPNSFYELEDVWNLLGAGAGATGGGVSAYWKIPSWQFFTNFQGQRVSVASFNGGSSTMRNMPDVAAVASPVTGVSVYSALNGGWGQIGGTSVSSPIWASYISIVDSAWRTIGLGHIGFVNPLLYYQANNTDGYDDITDGSNGNANLYGGIPGYTAGSGYDNCTGWGSMWGEDLVHNLLLFHPHKGPAPDQATGIHGTAAKTTARVNWTAAKNATGYVVEAIDLSNIFNFTHFASAGTHVELTGLLPATSYEIRVYSVNPAGSNEAIPLFLTTTK